MDVSNMLSADAQDPARMTDTRRQSHPYPTRQGPATHDQDGFAKPYSPAVQRSHRDSHGAAAAAAAPTYPRGSPAKKNQKHVVFQLIDPQDPRIQARLPMRVMISTHDTTESIITTVKNFYGLYDYGVSFENKDGISIIAAYDNFDNDMTVYVRTIFQPPPVQTERARDSISPKKTSLGPAFDTRPPMYTAQHSPAKSARSAGVRSMSPASEQVQRSASAAPSGLPRPQRISGGGADLRGDGDGYSSAGEGSDTSSRRSRSEQVNAEISVENIVEGGRRKRAFESSELPLFVPPQVPMPASISSTSPQRKNGFPNAPSPYATNQQTFSYTQALPSPQSHGAGAGAAQPHVGMNGNGYSSVQHQPHRQLRGRTSTVSYPPSRLNASGVLPTPDPTVGSAISDEDVALQLMRLGDPLAFSHGRTSTSTVDDALSGKAELASSEEDSEDEDDEQDEQQHMQGRRPSMAVGYTKADAGPQRKKQRLMNEPPSQGTSGEDDEDHRDGTFAGADAMQVDHDGRPLKLSKPKSGKPRPLSTAHNKQAKPRAHSMAKPKTKPLSYTHSHHPHNHHGNQPQLPTTTTKPPLSPTSMPAPSRKSSLATTTHANTPLTFQPPTIPGAGFGGPSSASTTTGGGDDEDLSSKPRCQRCRKSKKGCDRQRPCGRCKDAGIGAEGCLSEDEGNGRKGRYGRHMGVSVKKGDEGSEVGDVGGTGGVKMSGVMGGQVMGMGQGMGMGMGMGQAQSGGGGMANGYFLAPALSDKDKGRKRKK